MQYNPDTDKFQWDFWQDELGLIQTYSSEIDQAVLKVIHDLADESLSDWYEDIAKHHALDPLLVELIKTLLASADWVEYGNSPRGGWLVHGCEQELLEKYRQYIRDWWQEEPEV